MALSRCKIQWDRVDHVRYSEIMLQYTVYSDLAIYITTWFHYILRRDWHDFIISYNMIAPFLMVSRSQSYNIPNSYSDIML